MIPVLSSNQHTKSILPQTKHPNLSSQSINAYFDQLKLFLAQANTTNPISIITLQESWCDSKTDMNFFNLHGYNMVYDFSRLSKYMHNILTLTYSVNMSWKFITIFRGEVRV